MPEYLVSDAPQIARAAKADRHLFDRQYARQTLSGVAVFTGSETRGSSNTLIRMTTPGADPVGITCGMNKFAFAAHKDTVSALKSGDPVHIKGPIGSDSNGQTISLGDGCQVEPSSAPAQ